jgi:hypothetical protein
MQTQALRYVLAVILAVALAHLSWSAGIVSLLHHFYGHRVANVVKTRDLGSEREDLASSFVAESRARARRSGRPLLMFLGSSVTYGYPWQEAVIFSTRVAQILPDRTVANLSVIGEGTRWLSYIAHCTIDSTRRPDVLVVEVPLVNSIGNLRIQPRFAPRPCAGAGPAAIGYWRLALARPFGVGWLALLWDEESYDKPDQDLQVTRVPPSYFADRQAFATLEPQFEDELRQYLRQMSTMGEKVYVYVSPIYTPAIAEAGGDRLAVQHQIDLANRVCQEVKGVICLDTRPFGTQKDLFYNLTHLNQRGHRALADWFVRQISP